MPELTHFDDRGAARMVDVSDKPVTERSATASGLVHMAPLTAALIRDRALAKGDVLEVARIAGIQAAKRTGDWIPLCHTLPVSAAAVEFSWSDDATLCVAATVKSVGRTGVEMEALTAVAAAALTVYDMVKAIDRGVTLDRIRLDAKTGGRSGDYRRSD